jgi:hypothetical protein
VLSANIYAGTGHRHWSIIAMITSPPTGLGEALMRCRSWFAPVLAILLACAAGGAIAATPERPFAPQVGSAGSLGDPFVPNYRIVLEPQYPTTATPVSIHLIGPSPYPNRCSVVLDPQLIDTGHVALTVWPTAEPCSSSLWRQTFSFGLMPTGWHRVTIDVYYHPAASDSGGDSTRVLFSRIYDYFVAVGPVPPPPPPPPVLGLPYVESIRIVPFRIAIPVPIEPEICPGDSMGVFFSGHFPNPCFDIRRVEVIPRVQNFRDPPQPPLIRLVIDSTGCEPQRICNPQPTEWSTVALLPPLPNPGTYELPVEMAVGSCVGMNDSLVAQYFTVYRFSVSRCSTVVGPPCVLGGFDHPSGPGACDTHVSAGRPGAVVFTVKPSVPLSGLQGEFRFDQRGLRISRMAPIGPATGMHLTWSPTDYGAKFVMFAESGAPIPAAPWTTDGPPVPVLAMEVDQATNVRPAESTLLGSYGLLGSDLFGGAVPFCALRIRPDVAQICRERDCDRNGDGILDVRDLVLLVHCLTGPARCDPSGADCNADSLFDLDDVLCCARRLLGLRPCPECGPDSGVTRPEPIELSLGGLVESGNEVEVPIHLTYAERFSAARLAIDYPADRYEVVSTGLRQADSRWLELHEVRGGQVVIGLIRTGLMTLEVGQKVDLQLRLRLKAGQAPGGRIVASESDFSGGDGVKLIIEHGRTQIDLVGRASIHLSGARPNPFAGESRFSLTLDRAANVELGIYDVTGRLVSTLHRGALPAGTREFTWDGSNADGSQAATGVYFYRAAVRGSTVSRKLVLVRGN